MQRLSNFIFGMVAIVGTAVTVAGTTQGVGQGGQLAPLTQTADKLKAADLREMIVGLGYEVTDVVKDEGKEVYRIKVTSDGLDMPVTFSIAASGNYIWQTIALGEASPTTKFEELLKQNARVQPSAFYIASNNYVYMALAIENRAMTAIELKRGLTKLTSDVARTKEFWTKPAN